MVVRVLGSTMLARVALGGIMVAGYGIGVSVPTAYHHVVLVCLGWAMLLGVVMWERTATE